MTIFIFSTARRYVEGAKIASSVVVYDATSLRNPFGYKALHSLNGTDRPVRSFVETSPGFHPMLDPIVEGLADGQVHCFYCHGGFHRSVACAEYLADECEKQGLDFELHHVVLRVTRKSKP